MSETLTISGLSVTVESIAVDAAPRQVTVWHDLWRTRPSVSSPVVINLAGQPAADLATAWREPFAAILAAMLADPPDPSDPSEEPA